MYIILNALCSNLYDIPYKIARKNGCNPIWIAPKCRPLYPSLIYLVISREERIGK